MDLELAFFRTGNKVIITVKSYDVSDVPQQRDVQLKVGRTPTNHLVHSFILHMKTWRLKKYKYFAHIQTGR